MTTKKEEVEEKEAEGETEKEGETDDGTPRRRAGAHGVRALAALRAGQSVYARPPNGSR